MNILLSEKRVPVWARYDVAVVGGGIAGAAAAVAAARTGARVCLIEKMQVLGGLATAGNVVVFLPLCDGLGNQVSFGIAEEMIRLPLRYSAARLPPAWERKLESTREERMATRFELAYDPAPMMVALEQFLLENLVELVFDTQVIDVIQDEARRLSHLVLCNVSGTGAFEVGSVVDASGEASVAAMAGERTETQVTDKPGCWYFSVNESRQVSLRCRSGAAGGHAAESGASAGPAYDPTDYRDVSRFLVDSHRRAADAAAALGPGNHLFALPSMHNFTKTRRLCGAYALTEADVGRHVEDGVGTVADWRKAGPTLEIPARALHGAVPNLFAAGRCISASGDAWEMTRTIPACAVTGEAAGKGAAQSAARKNNPNPKDKP